MLSPARGSKGGPPEEKKKKRRELQGDVGFSIWIKAENGEGWESELPLLEERWRKKEEALKETLSPSAWASFLHGL